MRKLALILGLFAAPGAFAAPSIATRGATAIASAVPGLAMLTADMSTSSIATPVTVFTLSTSGAPTATLYKFHCVIGVVGTTTSAPTFEVLNPDSSTTISYTVYGFKTSVAVITTEAFNASSFSASCTVSCIAATSQTAWTIDGVINTAAASSTISVLMLSSTAAQTVTAKAGSFCSVWN